MTRDVTPGSLQPRTVSGHFWTLTGYIRSAVWPPRAPESQPWRTTVQDPDVGDIRLTGRLSHVDDGRLLVVLHGIAGCSGSGYMVRTAAAAVDAGVSCLRLNARGADRSGEDLFHAGLSADVHSVLASPELARYRSVGVLGFSLGGHVTLRAATEEVDPRLAGVVAVCAPLDLSACVDAFDGRGGWAYRRRILRELSAVYEQVARRRAMPVPAETIRRLRSLRDFDDLAVAPRFGFSGAEDYYRRMSAGPVLDRLRVPALLVVGVSDPLVPLATLTPFLTSVPAQLETRFVEQGGHVGFPAGISLGESAPPGLEPQTIAWLWPKVA